MYLQVEEPIGNITCRAKDISAIDLIECVCLAANCSWLIVDGKICVFGPGTTYDGADRISDHSNEKRTELEERVKALEKIVKALEKRLDVLERRRAGAEK